MKITDTILKALDKAIKTAGNKSQLAHKSGVSKSLIGKYVKQEITDITLENLYKLEPFLKPYLSNNPLNFNYGNQGFALRNLNQSNNNDDGKSDLRKKIMNDKDLNSDEKIKFLKLLD